MIRGCSLKIVREIGVRKDDVDVKLVLLVVCLFYLYFI
jgi:hypothetical protein